MTGAGWSLRDHTADVALALHADTEEGLLRVAAQAVVALLTEGAAVGGGASREVALEALDPEDRLVRWMNEVLYLAIAQGFLVSEVPALALGGAGLRATVRGEEGAGDRVRTELKSVTYHDLRVARTAGGWEARVVIDV